MRASGRMRRVRARCAAKVGAHTQGACLLGWEILRAVITGLALTGSRVPVTPWSNVKIAVTSLPARIISGLPGAWPVGRALSQQTVTTENANEN